MGNTTKGQVPSGTTGILVDPMTTPWVDNANLYLAAEDDSLDGVVFEGGIINEKADNIGKAFNAVSLGTKAPRLVLKQQVLVVRLCRVLMHITQELLL